MTPLTHAEWIASRRPEAPERLVARVREVLASQPDSAALSHAEALLRAGEVLLAQVLRSDRATARDDALDLLAADACVTWAFEAAADEPATLRARAREAMERIAGVAA